jgi:hypothetical protein
MRIRTLVTAGLVALGVAGAAMAGDGEHRVVKHKMHGGASVEFMAMHNIMAEQLSAKSGKTVAEINALFEKGGPHEVADALGIKHEEMRDLMKQARITLIARAQAANLITAAQAEKLRQAKIEVREKRVHKESEDD